MSQTFYVALVDVPDDARNAVLPILVEYAHCTRSEAKKAWYARKRQPVFATSEQSVVDFLLGDLKQALRPWPGASAEVV